jgi:hypothetical protein
MDRRASRSPRRPGAVSTALVLLALTTGCGYRPPETPERAYDQVRDASSDEDYRLLLRRFTDAGVEQLALVCALHGLHDWARLRAQEILDEVGEELIAPGGPRRPGALVAVMRRHGFEDAGFERLTAEVRAQPDDPFASDGALRERCARIRDRRAFVRDLLPLFRWGPIRTAHVTDVEVDGDTATGHLVGDYEHLQVRFLRERGRWRVDGFVSR